MELEEGDKGREGERPIGEMEGGGVGGGSLERREGCSRERNRDGGRGVRGWEGGRCERERE